MKEKLTEAHKFKLWKSNLIANGLKIHNIEEVFTRFRHNGEALFSLVMLDATTPEGDKIPPICFIKGQIVSVLICLIDEATKDKYLLLVKQRRICHGGYVFEHVAGMVDIDDDPHDVAVRETEEESGIQVDKSQVILLNKEPLYASSGTSDEALFFYYCELEMSREKIMSYHDRLMGVDHEHERIYTHITTIPESLKLITNTNGLLNVYMYLEAVG
ncbi:MAG: NUDIX hydrolase [Bacteroidia bacterium]